MFVTIILGCWVVSLIGYVWYMSSSHRLFKKMGVPGPAPWPVLGNLMDEMGGNGIVDFHIKMYLQYKKDKVYGIFRTRRPTMVICDLDMVRDICVKQFNNFANRLTFDVDPPFCYALTDLKDDHWKRVRSTVSPCFSTGKLRKMQPHIERNTRLLLEHLKDKQERNEPVELRDLLSAYTMDVIASTGFGIESNSLKDPDNEFTKAGKGLMDSMGRFLFIVVFLKFIIPLLRILGITPFHKESMDFFSGFIKKVIQYRKADKAQASERSDFIQLMLEAEQESQDTIGGVTSDGGQQQSGQDTISKKVLSNEDIQGQALIFLLAGYDTVATALSFTLFLIALNPDCLEKAQEEVDKELGTTFPDYDSVQSLHYIEMCINEAMRLYSSGFILDRICEEETVVQGVRIPKGMLVTIPVCGIHRDPELWEDPDTFNPDRFTSENKATRHTYAFLPFGQGPRNCIGMTLAILECKVALAAILQTLTPVSCEKTVYPVTLDKFQLKAKEGLWVKFETRQC